MEILRWNRITLLSSGPHRGRSVWSTPSFALLPAGQGRRSGLVFLILIAAALNVLRRATKKTGFL